MDSTVLVEVQYEEGKKLIEKLDEKGKRFPVSLWINYPDTSEWLLLFGVPRLKTTGSKQLLKFIHGIIVSNAIKISLGDISLVDSTSPVCRDLRTAVKTGWKIGKIPFFGHFINGQRFPDALIYRVK
jgi:hypothetical protein